MKGLLATLAVALAPPAAMLGMVAPAHASGELFIGRSALRRGQQRHGDRGEAMTKTPHGVMSRRRMAWLVFDIIGWLVYLVACCVWLGLVRLEQPAPPTPVPLTVQKAMNMNGPSASDGPSDDRTVVDTVEPKADPSPGEPVHRLRMDRVIG